jgi:hypothetical protein
MMRMILLLMEIRGRCKLRARLKALDYLIRSKISQSFPVDH